MSRDGKMLRRGYTGKAAISANVKVVPSSSPVAQPPPSILLIADTFEE